MHPFRYTFECIYPAALVSTSNPAADLTADFDQLSTDGPNAALPVFGNSVRGELFMYENSKRLCAFEGGAVDSESSLVFIGGFTDGFLCNPYV